MANVFDITIKNESGLSQAYLLFAEAPQVAGAGQVFSNVYMAAPPIASSAKGSSTGTFSITRQFYGICGTSIHNLKAGVSISTSDYKPVTLGHGSTPGTSLSFSTTGGAAFQTPDPAPAASVGAYSIQTDSSFVLPNPNNTFIGLGGIDMNGNVRPIATFLAAPSSTYNIYPVVKYYIATGSYTPGEIINVQAIGKTQLVDFTFSTYSSQTFVHNNDGTYTQEPLSLEKFTRIARLLKLKAAEQGTDALVDMPGKKPAGKRSDIDMEREIQRALLKVLNGLELHGHHNGRNGHHHVAES